MPPWMSLAEYNRRQHALYLLSLLERSGGDPKKLRELLERERRRLEEWRRKLEGMSDEEFYRMISGDPFGVASKSYYIERARKRLKELERIEMDAKTLLKYLHDDYENEYDRFGVEDFIGRYMRGYINRLKQLKKKLQQRKNSPLTSFAEEGGKVERRGGRKAKPRRRLERPKKIYKWAGSRRALEKIIKKYGAGNVRVISKVPVGGWLLEIRTFS